MKSTMVDSKAANERGANRWKRLQSLRLRGSGSQAFTWFGKTVSETDNCCTRCGKPSRVRYHYILYARYALCPTCDAIFISQVRGFMKREKAITDLSELGPLFESGAEGE